jgi:hypothetical protein
MMADSKTESESRTPSPFVKSCVNCRHVKTCFLYRMALRGIQAFDAEAEGIVKFPMKAEAIAYKCPEFESPLDIIKKSEMSQ